MEKTEYKFKSKWDENTEITPWRISKIELNQIIDLYNRWQMEEDFNADKARLVLAKIEYGKQIICENDNDSEYWPDLDDMEKFVREHNI